jgi:N-acyl-D-amino-acid deacylase
VLGRYVRELKLLKLEEAIRRMTSLPAETFQIKDRGMLKPGAIADVVIFDPEKVTDPSTFDDPHHHAAGFEHVLVNGVPVIESSALAESRPGQIVRRGR